MIKQMLIWQIVRFLKFSCVAEFLKNLSPKLPAPDTQLTNTDGRALCHICVTRWVGRGGVGITCFSSIHVRVIRPAIYERSKQYVFERKWLSLGPIQTNLEVPEGFA